MTCGLFSLFDPMSFSLPLKWVMVCSIFVMVWQLFSLQCGVNIFHNFVYKIFFKNFLSKSSIYSCSLLFVPYKMILFYNVMGLLPYSFPITSHLVFNLSLALPLWIVSFVLISSMKNFLSHLVPHSSPMFLSPFLVMVESVSLIIRPLTLSIRLMANVTAGHLIMSIVSMSNFMCSFMFQLIYVIFEFFIMLIQAFVFVNLLSMYWEE